MDLQPQKAKESTGAKYSQNALNVKEQGTGTKSTKTIPNFDVQDDIYVVNVTDFVSELLAVRYSSDHKLLAIGGASSTLLTVRPNTHEVLGTFGASKGDIIEYDPITCIREHPSSIGDSIRMMSSFASGQIQCWDVNSRELKFTVKEPRQSLGLAVSPHNFITTGDDGVLYVYDINTNSVVARLESSPDGDKVDGHSTRSFSAVFHPHNPNEAISGGWDDSIHFWDVRQKHSVRRVSPAHICGSDALDFSIDGTEILAGSYQKTKQIQMWEYATGKLVRVLATDTFTSSLYAAIALTDSVICTGGADPSLFRAVNIHQKVTIGLVKNMPGGVSSIHKAGVGLKFPAKSKLNKGRDKPAHKAIIPRVAYCAGQYLYEVEFY